MRKVALALLAVLPMFAPGSVNAQQAQPSLASLAPGCCTLRVRNGKDKAQGRLQSFTSPRALTLFPCEGALCPRAGPAEHVLTLPPGALVDMQAGRQTGTGALWGAALGAVTLTAVFLGDQDLDASTGEKIAIGLPLGALGGGGIGALIGALFPKWKPVRP